MTKLYILMFKKNRIEILLVFNFISKNIKRIFYKRRPKHLNTYALFSKITFQKYEIVIKGLYRNGQSRHKRTCCIRSWCIFFFGFFFLVFLCSKYVRVNRRFLFLLLYILYLFRNLFEMFFNNSIHGNNIILTDTLYYKIYIHILFIVSQRYIVLFCKWQSTIRKYWKEPNDVPCMQISCLTTAVYIILIVLYMWPHIQEHPVVSRYIIIFYVVLYCIQYGIILSIEISE